jgi:hypothetical protein
MNPGLRQVKFPCQICNRAGKWKQETLACDNCDGWYHVECMKMQSAVYKALAKPNAIWVCCTCGLPNYSTSLFEQCSFDTSNSLSSLSDLYNFSAELKSPTDLGPPLHSSSPRQFVDKIINELKVLTINFQSICNKREVF